MRRHLEPPIKIMQPQIPIVSIHAFDAPRICHALSYKEYDYIRTRCSIRTDKKAAVAKPKVERTPKAESSTKFPISIEGNWKMLPNSTGSAAFGKPNQAESRRQQYRCATRAASQG